MNSKATPIPSPTSLGLCAGALFLGALSAGACYVGLDVDDPRRGPRLSAGDATDLNDNDTDTDSDAESYSDSSSPDTPEPPPADDDDALEWLDPCRACGCLTWTAHLPSPGLDVLRTALAPANDEGLLLAVATADTLYLSRLAPNGALEWTHEWSGTFHDIHLTATDEGLFALAVTFSGSLQVGVQPPIQSAGSTDGMLLLFSEDAPDAAIWQQTFGGSDAQRVTGLVASPGCRGDKDTPCRLILAGSSTGALGLRGLNFAYNRPYVAEFDLDGQLIDVLAPPSAELHDPPSLALTPQGAPLLLTTQRDLNDLGDLALDRWDPKNNVWITNRIIAPGEQRSVALAAAPDGSLRLVGRTLAPIELAGAHLGANDLETPFITALVDDQITWARQLAAWPAGPHAIAVLQDATTMLTGDLLTNNVDLGGGPLPHLGATDAFLLQLGGSGAHSCSRAYGDLDHQRGLAVAAHPGGRAFALVRSRGKINPSPGMWQDRQFDPEDLVILALDRFD